MERNMNIEAISIRNIKRYAAEHAGKAVWKEKSKYLPKTGKKICVVGGGPAGMTAAYYLKKQDQQHHELRLLRWKGCNED